MRVFFFCLLVCWHSLWAAPLSERELDERITDNQSANLSEEALKLWQDALVELEGAKQAVQAEKEARLALEKLGQNLQLTLPQAPENSANLARVEEVLARVESEITSTDQATKALKNESDESPSRSAALAKNLDRTQQALSELKVPDLESGELEAARHQVALQTRRRLEALLAQLQAEKVLLTKKEEVYTQRLRRRMDHLEELRALEGVLSERLTLLKKEESDKTRQSLEQSAKVFSAIPELAEIVTEVQELNEQRAEGGKLRASLENADRYRESVQKMRRRIKEQFENARRRIELFETAKLGLDDKTGLLLRKERSRLPSTDQISGELRQNLERAAKAQISMLDLSDRISSLDVLSEKRMSELLAENPRLKRSAIEALIEKRTSLLQDLKSEYTQLNFTLSEGIESAKYTIAEINEYSGYIDERLLWIKSTDPLDLREPFEEWARLVDLMCPATLQNVLQSIQRNWFSKIASISVIFLVGLGIFLRRGRLCQTIKRSNQEAVRRNCTVLLPTIKNLIAVFLLSLWLPLLFILFSFLIDDPSSWRAAIWRLATTLLLVNCLIHFSRPEGLFVSHFKMHQDRAALIFRNLKWSLPFVLPAVFIVTALTHSEVSSESGRFSFVLAMVLVLGVNHHLFHPERSILQKEGKSSPFTKVAYFVLMAVPVIFALGASLGYFASVLTLRSQVVATAGLFVLAFIVTRFLTRWTLVSRRRLAISQALRRREAALAEREREEEGEDTQPELPSLEEVKAEAVDVVEVEGQTTQLLRLVSFVAVCFGLWVIWFSTLPALSVLDKVTIWGEESPALAAELNSPETPALPSLIGPVSEAKDGVEKLIQGGDSRVSLQDLFLTIIFFMVTFMSARNLPGLLSLTLFSRINLGPGGNFALTTTVRYLIVLVGVVLALQQIGITWGKVQWLAAAITLGIGFGLQEIFANFVAGIIMLFERPVRLGDVVTVGDISGRVTQIKIRATTIQQFNNRELLVPNKEFITSQLVNWTLKDSVLRLEIPVGIAYGSDTAKATEVFKSVLKKHPHVLDEPKPDILFENFGNSTLDFRVRGFVSGVSHLISVRSDLHYEIDNALREVGIEIAFPQQDIHLRTLPEGLQFTPKS